MSFGVCPEKTRIIIAIIPLVRMASLSAVKRIFPSLCSALSQTFDWQPLMMYSSVLYFSSIIGSDFPSSIMYSYRSVQSSNRSEERRVGYDWMPSIGTFDGDG